jgi:3-hydroxyacyl-[acyl-carrier protein] dehydratase/trans-2-decenoyl-[acyl-carrier protein] isomerase
MIQQDNYSYSELESMFATVNAKTMQLPQGEMRMIDRIVHVSSTGGRYNKGELIAEFDVHPDLWFFKCHFPGDPVMPGCLGVDGLWQSLGFYLAWAGYEGKGRALGVGDVRFTGEVSPSAQTVRFHIHLRRILLKDMVLGIADGEVYVDDQPIYSAKKIKTGLLSTSAKNVIN